MSKKFIALLTGALLVACVASVRVTAQEEEKPKFTTKEVMKTAMKGGLLKKVAAGDASDEEKKQLHEMLVALSKNQPKKGDAESWKELTGALVKAGKAAVDGDADAAELLKKASNCKACHDKHK